MFIVTGGGSGIGRALTHQLAKLGHNVLICGRRQEMLKETAIYAPKQINYIVGDLTVDSTISDIYDATKDVVISGLIQNAAQLEPLSVIESLSIADYREHQAINVEAPIALFKKLRAKLTNARVLHISSAAAHHPFPGWGAYCISKSSLFMLYQILKQECPDVYFGSVMPGITDTSMQKIIRQSSQLPEKDRLFFSGLYENKALLDTKVVAQFLVWLLLETSSDEFSEKEWDIYEQSHHQQWLKSGIVTQC